MNFACLFFGTAFCICGILFARGELLQYISAWKNMPDEEKQQINIVPLCRNIGEIISLSGIIFLLNGLFPVFQKHWFTGAMIAWLIIAGLDVWFISKSKRYRQ